ncbi:hypothetical protein SAMN04244548_03105 [Paracoccus pantotrophus]|nr:hypothetical protein SAMN04244548_03105 [Paracoccus pantotrophus]
MSQGKEFLVAVSATSAGDKTEVELQGDLTINPGKAIQQQVYKNGTESFQNDSGFNISFQMGNSAPLATGEALLWTLHDSGDVGYFEITNARTGGVEWTFAGRVGISTVNAPVSGATTVTVNVGAVGAVTRGTAT